MLNLNNQKTCLVNLLSPCTHSYIFNIKTVWLISIIIISTNLYTHLTLLPSQHIAWHILGIERWLAGGKYYYDFYEINTPFATALYIPAVLISKLLNNVSIYKISYIFNTFFFIIWAFFCKKIITLRNPELNSITTNNYFIAILWSFLILPSVAFADRDPFIGALMLPYVCILFSSLGFKTHVKEKKILFNALAAFATAYGLLIKPHYIITFILIHLLNFIYYKNLRYSMASIITITLTIFIGVTITYLFFHEWFKIGEITLKTYSAYNSNIFEVIGNIIILIGIPFAYFKTLFPEKLSVNRFFIQKNPLLYGFFISGFANSIVYFFQFKGWYYHTIPILISLWIIPLSQPHRFLFIFIILTCTASFNLKLNYENSQTQKETFIWKMNTILKLAQKNDSFICISPDMSCNYPLSLVGPYKIDSRYPALSAGFGAKMLSKNQTSDKIELKKILDKEIENSTEDIIIKKPEFIIIEWQRNSLGAVEDFSNNHLFNYTLKKNYKLIDHKDSTYQSIWIYFKNPIKAI